MHCVDPSSGSFCFSKMPPELTASDTLILRVKAFMQSSLPDGAEEGGEHVEEDAASQCSPQATSKWMASKASVLGGNHNHGESLDGFFLTIAS